MKLKLKLLLPALLFITVPVQAESKEEKALKVELKDVKAKLYTAELKRAIAESTLVNKDQEVIKTKMQEISSNFSTNFNALCELSGIKVTECQFNGTTVVKKSPEVKKAEAVKDDSNKP